MLVQLEIETPDRHALVDLTAQVERLLDQSGVSEGICHLFVPHTTAGLTLNESWDPDVGGDLLLALEGLVPGDARYRHGEGNADAHIKAALTGASASVPISGGRLTLGRWQGIYLAEFDGPRRRQVLVKIISG